MGVLSLSSVKNDLLIYGGMMGCWPLGWVRPDTSHMAAAHSLSASRHLWLLLFSSCLAAQTQWGMISGILGYFSHSLSPTFIRALAHFRFSLLGHDTQGH